MSVLKLYYQNAAATIIKNLRKRQMEGYYCESSEEAVELALSLMPEGSSIAWGGSMSLEECGLMDAIRQGDYRIIDRGLAKKPEKRNEVYSQIINADFFLMSTNAITLDGELVNIDGKGSRLAFLCYGPEQVLLIVGMNKVCSDVDSAFKRVRDIASPKNTVRLNLNTPCAKTGRCGACYSEDCICSQELVTRFSSIPGRIKVILVGEELGY